MQRSIFVRTLIGCLFLTLAIPAAAGQNRWTLTGPEGAEIHALLVPPFGTFMYAVTASSTLYRSPTDREPSWVSVRSDLRGAVLASTPDNPNVIYAATDLRLLQSTDAGSTWREMVGPLPGPPTRLAFVSENVGFLIASSRLWITHDGGASWNVARLGLHREVVVTLDGVVLAISRGPDTTSDALYESSDLGQSWRILRDRVDSLALSPSANLPYFFAQTMYASRGKDIHVSRDLGRTWQPLPPLPDLAWTPLALSASDDRVFAVAGGPGEGVYEYDESSGRWSALPALPTLRRPTAVSGAAGHLYASTEAGIFITSSPYDEWRSVSQGIREGSVRGMALSGNRGVYAATAGGLFKSADGAESWRAVEGIVRPDSVGSSFGTTYVASPSGIHRSSDDGETWSVVTPRNASWVGTSSQSPSTLYASFTSGLERSGDGGTTWTAVPHPWYFSWAVVDPDDSERIYVGAKEGWDPWGKLYRIDQSVDWTREVGPPGGPYSLNTAAVRGSVLHVAMGCESWTLPDYRCGVTTSLDGGTNWSALRLSDGDIRSLAIDPARPWRSYAGTASGRVYRSDDFGNEWAPFGEGLSGGSVRHLAISSDGDRIYAGTAGGVFVYQIAPEESVFELLPADPQRLPRLMDQLLATQGGSTASSASGLLIPAAGRVRGSSGVTFHTDVTLANGRATEQDVFVAWLPQGNPAGANVSTFRLTLPAAAGNDDGALTLDDLADDLGLDGLGSLLVFAVDGAGNVDTDAEIDGFARIRSRSECGGWVSQSLAAVPADAFTTAQRSQVIGLRHEASYRTNIGVVNLSASSRDFTVIARGEGATEQFTITVPSFAPVLAAIPNRNYGAVTLTVIGNGASAPSVSYGSSVDNASGDAWAAVARPRRTP